MKGDFSRLRFTPSKNYTSVLQQQGRVSLDADANEQCAINEYLRATETVDVVGLVGGPVDDEGFGITIVDKALVIAKGRYYVEGILCENEQPLLYGNQPYLINPGPDGPELLAELSAGSISAIQLYLEVWRRLVTDLDDPCLREPAIGQADTTARLQTVWRVVAKTVAAVSRRAAGDTLALPAEDVLMSTSVAGKGVDNLPIPPPSDVFTTVSGAVETPLQNLPRGNCCELDGERPGAGEEPRSDECANFRRLRGLHVPAHARGRLPGVGKPALSCGNPQGRHRGKCDV